MRNFLHKLAAFVTRQPRGVIEPNFVKGNWVHNYFRTYEYYFGRRAGIRFEAGFMDGVHVFGTWEALFAHLEGAIRRFDLGLRFVPLPQLALADGSSFASPFRFAIAYVGGADWDANTTHTMTVTNLAVAGANLMMLGFGWSANSGTYVDYQYNSVSFVLDVTSAGSQYGTHLVAPTVGTANAVFTNTGNAGQYCAGMVVVYYSGVNQTGIDQTDSNYSASQGGTWSPSVTTALTNTWLLAMYQGSNGTPSAGTGATGRIVASSGTGLPSAFDSNGYIATGGAGFTFNTGNSGQAGGYVALNFAEMPIPLVNVKTANGLALHT